MHFDHRYVRLVLTEREVLRAQLELGTEAKVRWSCAPNQTVRAVVREIRRSASRTNVPVELTMLAGGELYAQVASEEMTTAEPYLHVVLEADSAPLGNIGAGLTAKVLLDARVETLGSWVQRKFLNFVDAWWMS